MFIGKTEWVAPDGHSDVEVHPAILQATADDVNVVIFWAATVGAGESAVRSAYASAGFNDATGSLSISGTYAHLFDLPGESWGIDLVDRSESGNWLIEPAFRGGSDS